MEPDKIKQIVEAAIFAADGPLDRDALLLLFDEQERPEKADLSRSLEQISEDYAERGIELKEVASGFRFQVRKDLGPWVSRLWQEKPPRYSRAILETLALVAYRQPITRGEIEEIRGVSVSSHIIKSLLERNWVRVVGHRDVPGRPAMFATTRQFLDYFDLKSLEDLPPLSEIKDLDKLNEELALSDAPDPDSGDRADDDNDATAAFGARPEGEREARNEEIFAALDEEPELDDSTLMSIDKVDSVNAGFEEEFRRKPAPAEGTGEQAAKAADEDEQSPHE
ncbi:SMC-Scp complex subunit ScpB [Alloalcanivorax sp.]|uniref:SMC-Scp complex subunit ScpB n=1 Tax=Alloalcanivorax sp. TaxID=3020835 RepID=UPI00351844C9